MEISVSVGFLPNSPQKAKGKKSVFHDFVSYSRISYITKESLCFPAVVNQAVINQASQQDGWRDVIVKLIF